MVTKNTAMRGAARGEEEDGEVATSQYDGVIFSNVFRVLSRHDSLKEKSTITVRYRFSVILSATRI